MEKGKDVQSVLHNVIKLHYVYTLYMLYSMYN